MPIRTEHYLLEAFLDGDGYAAIADKRRFSTVDNQLNRIAEVIGDGRIDGWEISLLTFPNISVSPGSGIIEKFYVNTFNDSALELEENNTFHIYAQRRLGVIGSKGPRSNIASITYLDSGAPDAPTDLGYTNLLPNSVLLTWTGVDNSDFDNYVIERKESADSDYELIDTTTDENYQDLDLEEFTSYDYRIYSMDLSGFQSTYSTISLTTPLDTNPIQDPFDVSVVPSECGINVLWNKPSTLLLNKIDYWEINIVEMDSDDTEITESNQTLIVNKNLLYHRIDDLKTGQRYKIIIKTVDFFGRKSTGISKKVTTISNPAPRDPTSILYETIDANSNVKISLSWQDGDTPYDSAISHRYNIYIRINNDRESDRITVPIGSTDEIISLWTYDVNSGTYYPIPENKLVTIRITALDISGFESAGNYIRFVTSKFSAPLPLQRITQEFNVDENKIIISWANPSGNNGTKIVILKQSVEDPYSEIQDFAEETLELGTKKYIILNAGLNNIYYVSLYPIDETGEIGEPQQIEVLTPLDDEISLPAPPNNVEASSGDKEVFLTWEKSETLYTRFYKIYKKVGEISLNNLDWTSIDILDSNLLNFTDYGLTNNQTYSYYITAIDVYGRESVHLPEAININLIESTPKQSSFITEPTNVQLVSFSDHIFITWESILEEFDAFIVYRSKNNLHSWEKIASVSKSSFSYTDIALPLINNSTFFYTIEKVINDSDIVSSLEDEVPENAIFLGEVICDSADFNGQPNILNVREIINLSSPMSEYTDSHLLNHKHSGLNGDPSRIDLNSEVVVTDWETVDGRIWSTFTDISFGSNYILKVNDKIPTVFYNIDETNNRIIFSEQIVAINETTLEPDEEINIELRIIGVEETTGILSISKINSLHAKQIKFGKLLKEQFPKLNHEGRINENLIPSKYLLERYDNHTFIVKQGNTDPRKTFGDGTAFYCTILNDGNIQEVINFDLFNERDIVGFQNPNYEEETINNLKNDSNESTTISINDISNYYTFNNDYFFGVKPTSISDTTLIGEWRVFDPTDISSEITLNSNVALNDGWTTFDRTRNIVFHLSRKIGILNWVDPSNGFPIYSIQIDKYTSEYDLLAFEVAYGILYLIVSVKGGTDRSLFYIDPITGTTTQIGSTVSSFSSRMLVFNHNNDTMYLYGFTSSLQWGTLDLTDNTFTFVGTPSNNFTLYDGAFLNRHSSLSDSIYARINRTTGRLYSITNLGIATLVTPSNKPDATTLSYPDSENMWRNEGFLGLINLGDFNGLSSDVFIKLPVNIPRGSEISNATLTFTSASLIDDIIIDEQDSNFSILSGSWTETSSSLGWESSYLFTSANPAETTAQAKWIPDFIQSGFYQVSLFFTRGSNRSSKVPYTVNHANGSTIVYADQSNISLDRIWINIGTFYFNEGENHSVIISNNAPSGVIIADAIRFTYCVSEISSGDNLDLELSYIDPTLISDSSDLSSSSISELSTIGEIQWSPEEWISSETSDRTLVDVQSLIADFVSRDDFYNGKPIFLKIKTSNTTTQGHFRTAIGYGENSPILDIGFTRNFAGVDTDIGGFQSEKSYRFNFEFQDSNEKRWVRITTRNADNKPNPIIDLKKRLKFKVLLTGSSVYLNLGIREINTENDIGEDGGISGPVKWAGVTEVIYDENGSPIPRGLLISPSSEWQDIDIDIPNTKIYPIDNNNSILSNGYGTIEHFAFTINPLDASPTGPINIFIDKLEQVNDLLVAGTSQGILLSENFGTNWSLSRYTETPVHKFYKSLTNGFLWAVSSTQILIATDPKYWFVLQGTSGIKFIKDISEDSDGNMYISTDKGVYFYDISLIRKFGSFKQTSGINPFTTECYGLYTNEQSSAVDEIWVSTEIGIFTSNTNGDDWDLSNLSDLGLPILQFINIGTSSNPIIYGITRKHLIRKTDIDISFKIITNFEIEHDLTKLSKIAYCNNKLYITTENGIYYNTDDLIHNKYIDHISFKNTIPGTVINNVNASVFGLDVIDLNNEQKLFVGQENRLLSVDESNKSFVKQIMKNKESPTFYIENQEINNGYVYNSFNNVLCFIEPIDVFKTVSSSFLPRRSFVAENGGWASSNPVAECFIYKNGFPAWLDFALDESSIIGELQDIQGKLNSIINLNDFNSLYPKSQELLDKNKAVINIILSGGENNSPLINKENIIEFLNVYSQFLWSINQDLHTAYNLLDPSLFSIGFDKSNRTANSRASTLEELHDFESEDSTNIQINTNNGTVDFTQAYSLSTSTDRRNSLSFDKYDKLTINIFNANLSETGEFTHTEIEDKLEDINSGMPSDLTRVSTSNLIKLGVSIESIHSDFLSINNTQNIQSKFYSSINPTWYDIVNSTIDYEMIEEINSLEVPHMVFSHYIFENDDPYFSNTLWLGTDKGILQYGIENQELSLNDIILLENSSEILDFCSDSNGTIYTISKTDQYRIFKTIDNGVSWEEIKTFNLPEKIYKIVFVNGNLIAATNNGVFYKDNEFDTWYKSTLFVSNHFASNTEPKNIFDGPFLNLLNSNNLIISEASGWFYVSNFGIDFFAPGRILSNDVSIVNKVLRHQNITWVGTDKGLYQDSNSILSDIVDFQLQTIEDSLLNSSNVQVNDIISVGSILYCCASNGKIYRYYDKDVNDSIGNEWLSYHLQDFGTIHKIIPYTYDDEHYILAISYNKFRVIYVTPELGVFG